MEWALDLQGAIGNSILTVQCLKSSRPQARPARGSVPSSQPPGLPPDPRRRFGLREPRHIPEGSPRGFLCLWAWPERNLCSKSRRSWSAGKGSAGRGGGAEGGMGGCGGGRKKGETY